MNKHSNKYLDSAFAMKKSLLACLRAMDWNYRTAHWQAVGDAMYADHLMFQRFYEAIPDEVDALAEKMVAGGSSDDVDAFDQAFRLLENLKSWNQHSCPFQRGLVMERDLQQLLQWTRKRLDAAGILTLGMDNLLAGISDKHETHSYLLKQRLLQMGAIKKAYTSLEKGWSGNSTFPSLRNGELDGPGRDDNANLEEESDHYGGDEGYFRVGPNYREVNELAQSGAITNLPDAAGWYSPEQRERAEHAPPSPQRILKEDPWAGEFSTLSRYLVDTAQKNRRP